MLLSLIKLTNFNYNFSFDIYIRLQYIEITIKTTVFIYSSKYLQPYLN